MRFVITIAFALSACALDIPTSSGSVRGFTSEPGVSAYLGIPFAAPPIGELRFQKPQKPNRSQHTINATKFSKACIQFQYKTPVVVKLGGEIPESDQSEDCLYLNIWTPAGRRRERNRKGLATMLWIHGGGYGEGTAGIDAFDGTHIVKNHQDVIVVSINYRLNLFGFPVSPALGGALNLGLLDQRAAVEWVHSNIANFGGDPNRITLFGESAGGSSVSSYAYAYPDDPKVAGLIMQSGTAEILGDPGPEEFLRVSKAVGCDDKDDSKRVKCFKKVDAKTIQGAISNRTLNWYAWPNGGMPGVDNKTVFTMEEFITRGFVGRFAKVPVLVGSNNHEGDFVIPFNAEKGINTTLSDIMTKTLFTCGSALQAMYRANNKVPVYRYRYMARFPSISWYPWMRDGTHFAETPVLFGTMNTMAIRKVDETEKEAIKYMQKLWVAFANNPSDGLKNLGWPKYKTDGKTLAEIFGKNEISMKFVKSDKYDDHCDNPPQVPFDSFTPY
ncbi:Similar to Cholinesterase; acc. no. O62760 [Pyronema omphalodes CBS 100304]|uniref:Carboxylic ester hydrolase n=1 Tax=Pyronema omphalodes (strain CBS 100304) TaxID=1076935 RepID=U4LHE1_PYROM|nr:Similar to Cholinesterase; acc. no. O62760 [Pyronema omphalodes CBS 100304]